MTNEQLLDDLLLQVGLDMLDGGKEPSPGVATKYSAVLARMSAGWQPIATAPRDGTDVLLWAEAWEHSWGVQRGCYRFSEWECQEGSVKDNDPDFDPNREVGEDEEIDEESNLGPTHWHALPTAPVSP